MFKTKPLVVFLLLFLSLSLNAQVAVWKLMGDAQETLSNLQKDPSWSQIAHYATFETDLDQFRGKLASEAPAENEKGQTLSITLPLPDGSTRLFHIMESPVMEAELAAKYPEIKTYKGTDGKNYMRMILTDRWMKAYILTEEGDIIVEPLSIKDKNHYGVYHSYDISLNPESNSLKCGENGRYFLRPEERLKAKENPETEPVVEQIMGVKPVVLHKYRIAPACTGEWGADPQRGGGTVSSALAKMADALTYANAVYEKDFAIHMDLTGRNDLIIWLNPNTDPYQNADVGGSLLGQNTSVVNPIITPGFYEFGHVFTNTCSDVGGIASLGSVCSPSGKAAGVTCWYTTDVAYVSQRIFCHEMGHQFSAGHTFSNCNGNESGSRYEPGGGTTIMSYSGLCGALNVESGGPPHPNFFHTHSLQEVLLFTRDFLTCGEKVTTSNTYPTAQILTPSGLFLPIQTPFELKGAGTDMEDTTLTYSWEQYDNGDYGSRVGEVTATGPLFRVLFPGSSPNRVFPNWNSILSLKNVDVREVLPSNSRDLTFRLTVRDNHPSAGGASWETLKLKVTDKAGPFTVTFPNINTHRLIKNTCNRITWNVAKTNELPVNCQKVDILMFRNRDFSNPIVLKENTENDGSELIDIPDLGNNIRVRIVVKARDHIFFDISDADIVIVEGTTPSVNMGVTPNLTTLCLPDELKVNVRTCAFGGFTGDLNLFVESGLPAGSTYRFEKSTIGSSDQTNLIMDLRNLSDKTDLKVTVAAVTPAGDTLRDELNIQVISNDFQDEGLLTPVSGSSGANETPLFTWQKSRNAEFYNFELATTPRFGSTNVYSQTFISVDSLRLPILLKANTIYYWRLLPVNACGEGRASQTYAFQTTNKTCVDQPFTGNPEGLFPGRTKSVIVPIPFSGPLADMNVNNLEINANVVRDVNINLVSPKGTKVNLFNYNCAVTLDFKCSFDDDSPIPLTCPPNRNVRMMPFEPLSKLRGEDLKGDWVLEVVTRNTLRDGEIRNFTLQYCAELTVSPPQIILNGPLKLDPGQKKSILQDLLLTTDTDDGPANLLYTLVTIPSQGNLEINGNQLTYGSTFTQKDINDGLLSYTHNGSSNYYDGFSYTVSDGKGGWVGIENFSILVGPVSTRDTELGEALRVFPNPASDLLLVQLDAPLGGEAILSLRNLTGKECHKRFLRGERTIQLEVEDLPSGLYLLEYRAGDIRISKKIMIRR